jgi:hypothetical protein
MNYYIVLTIKYVEIGTFSNIEHGKVSYALAELSSQFFVRYWETFH